jgi:hypothetical protein
MRPNFLPRGWNSRNSVSVESRQAHSYLTSLSVLFQLMVLTVWPLRVILAVPRPDAPPWCRRPRPRTARTACHCCGLPLHRARNPLDGRASRPAPTGDREPGPRPPATRPAPRARSAPRDETARARPRQPRTGPPAPHPSIPWGNESSPPAPSRTYTRSARQLCRRLTNSNSRPASGWNGCVTRTRGNALRSRGSGAFDESIQRTPRSAEQQGETPVTSSLLIPLSRRPDRDDLPLLRRHPDRAPSPMSHPQIERRATNTSINQVSTAGYRSETCIPSTPPPEFRDRLVPAVVDDQSAAAETPRVGTTSAGASMPSFTSTSSPTAAVSIRLLLSQG